MDYIKNQYYRDRRDELRDEPQGEVPGVDPTDHSKQGYRLWVRTEKRNRGHLLALWLHTEGSFHTGWEGWLRPCQPFPATLGKPVIDADALPGSPEAEIPPEPPPSALELIEGPVWWLLNGTWGEIVAVESIHAREGERPEEALWEVRFSELSLLKLMSKDFKVRPHMEQQAIRCGRRILGHTAQSIADLYGAQRANWSAAETWDEPSSSPPRLKKVKQNHRYSDIPRNEEPAETKPRSKQRRLPVKYLSRLVEELGQARPVPRGIIERLQVLIELHGDRKQRYQFRAEHAHGYEEIQ